MLKFKIRYKIRGKIANNNIILILWYYDWI